MALRLLLKRDDLIHPELIGNKWRKLAPNLRAAAGRTVVTFGGAYSNHLRATAAAGRLLGLTTVGVVRGQELADRPQPLTDPLRGRRHATALRRQIDVSPQGRTGDAGRPAALGGRRGRVRRPGGRQQFPCRTRLPEFGAELRGHDGVHVAALACGTGGTLAGLAAGLAPDQRALGIPVLKGGFLGSDISALQEAASVAGAAPGRWTTASTSAATPAPRPNSTPSPRTSNSATACPWNVSMSPRCSTDLSPWWRRGAFVRGTTVAAVITGAPL